MGRRQGRTPPYEIMQNVGSGAPLPRSGVRQVRGGSVGLVGLAWGGIKAIGEWLAGLGGWIADFRGFSSILERFSNFRGGETATVRLPWPVLALLGVVGLAAMGLMFQIGHHVAGRSAGVSGGSDPTAQVEPIQPLTDDALTIGRITRAGQSDTVIPMAPVRIEPIQPLGGAYTEDPRLPGLNYFVLATVRPSEVNGVWALQQFLAERGVATFLDNANNGRFRVLVDVTRGFTREELRNLEHAEHEQMIRSLGREWKQQQGGIGTDLSDIYRDRFDGPPKLDP